MPRRVREMPAGAIGFEAIGAVEDDDSEVTVEPVLRGEPPSVLIAWTGRAGSTARARTHTLMDGESWRLTLR